MPGTAVAAPASAPPRAADTAPAYSYPIGDPGRPLGDGFFIRDAYASENMWYLPGYWHTAEDWYRQGRGTAGARVYAIAGSQVVYADFDYPGRVVIVRHAGGLYSMYGHLDPALAVRVGQRVARGDLIGRVLDRQDGVPSHLHFEVRTFLETPAVNGDAPRYGFKCGVDCPPGPGYWPISAPDHPSDLGWCNPTHVINRRAFPAGTATPRGGVAVPAAPATSSADLWTAPSTEPEAQRATVLTLNPGDRYPLLAISAGPEASRGSSAEAYDLWYKIRLPSGQSGWAQAAVPSTFDTGSDGRPSSIVFDFVPAVLAAP